MRLSRPLAVLLAAGLLGGAVLAQAGDATASRAAQGRGEALLKQGDIRAARVEFMNAIKADPSNIAARLAQARVALELGQWDIAAEQLQRVRLNWAASRPKRPTCSPMSSCFRATTQRH